jgi:osmotically-inducible protein OsmY
MWPHVSTYAQRLAAARAAEGVYGVKAVANAGLSVTVRAALGGIR